MARGCDVYRQLWPSQLRVLCVNLHQSSPSGLGPLDLAETGRLVNPSRHFCGIRRYGANGTCLTQKRLQCPGGVTACPVSLQATSKRDAREKASDVPPGRGNSSSPLLQQPPQREPHCRSPRPTLTLRSNGGRIDLRRVAVCSSPVARWSSQPLWDQLSLPSASECTAVCTSQAAALLASRRRCLDRHVAGVSPGDRLTDPRAGDVGGQAIVGNDCLSAAD